MEDIPVLPIFYKLRGARVVVAGGDAPVVWKTEVLLAAGASITVFAEHPIAELVRVAEKRSRSLEIIRRSWTEADLAGAAMAIGSFEDELGAAQFCDSARRHGVPVNVIDRPAYCDFQFGTMIARSPLVIGVSTDGAAPVLGQALRVRIEALLPQTMRAWAQAAKSWRPLVQRRDLTFRERRRFWECFSALAFDGEEREPTSADLDRCFAEAERESGRTAAELAFVGCGDGSADSVTLHGLRILQSADVILCDSDVTDAAAQLARREALRIRLKDDLEQSTMISTTLSHLEAGRRVVWLGTGDPKTCVRWRELSSAFATRGFEQITRVAGLRGCAECGTDCRAALSTG